MLNGENPAKGYSVLSLRANVPDVYQQRAHSRTRALTWNTARRVTCWRTPYISWPVTQQRHGSFVVRRFSRLAADLPCSCGIPDAYLVRRRGQRRVG
jgi:hypothetical protein